LGLPFRQLLTSVPSQVEKLAFLACHCVVRIPVKRNSTTGGPRSGQLADRLILYLLNFVLVKERIAFQAYSTLMQNVPLSTRGSINSSSLIYKIIAYLPDITMPLHLGTTTEIPKELGIGNFRGSPQMTTNVMVNEMLNSQPVHFTEENAKFAEIFYDFFADSAFSAVEIAMVRYSKHC
jgi:hypothetical protein